MTGMSKKISTSLVAIIFFWLLPLSYNTYGHGHTDILIRLPQIMHSFTSVNIILSVCILSVTMAFDQFLHILKFYHKTWYRYFLFHEGYIADGDIAIKIPWDRRLQQLPRGKKFSLRA